MTTQKTETAIVQKDTTLSPQPSYWVDGMLPVFFIDKNVDADDFLKAVNDTHGYQVYYVIGESSTPIFEKKNNANVLSGYHVVPKMFKVTNNMAGMAVNEVKSSGLKASTGLGEVETFGMLKLPKIPISLIKRIDDFFRYVYDKLGTESVIVFTYDPTFRDTDEPENGWGFLVPKQENTAATCSYDVSSVIDEKDEHVSIVGTAHSHPKMGAFCSGTDTKDQQSMDGLHITFGWTSGLTDYHIELQIGGVAYEYEIENVFEATDSVEDEELKGWVKNVSKQGPSSSVDYGHWSNYGWGSEDFYYNSATRGDDKPAPKALPVSHTYNEKMQYVLISEFANEEMVSKNMNACPACYKKLTGNLNTSRKCYSCGFFILPHDMTVIDLIEERKEKNVEYGMLTGDSNTSKQGLVVWSRFETKDGRIGHSFTIKQFDNEKKS